MFLRITNTDIFNMYFKEIKTTNDLLMFPVN